MKLRSPARLARARFADRTAAAVITAGGALILLSVALLVLFLVLECLPLLRTPSATCDASVQLAASPLLVLEDEYREGLVSVGREAVLRRVTVAGVSAQLPLEGSTPLAQAVASADGRLIAVLDGAGTLRVWAFRLRTRWQGNDRVLEPAVRELFTFTGATGRAILAVGGEGESAGVLLASPRGASLVVAGQIAAELSLGVAPRAAALSSTASEAWIAVDGRLAWFDLAAAVNAGEVEPAAVAALPAPASVAAVLLGDMTCLVGDLGGNVTAWQVVAGVLTGSRRIERSAEFAGVTAVRSLAVSQRDKSFAIVRTGGAEIAHLTTRRTLVTLRDLPEGARLAGLSPRRDGFFAVADDGTAYRWKLAISHPEASLATLFSSVRYEGFSKAEYVWQSTGGTAAFEPKLSLLPLVVGTLKGALYALLFSAPCALLAALYVSQFAPRRVKVMSKPIVELMAALPSVVVGFLAALLLAPVVQRHLVGLTTSLVLLPILIGVAGLGWSALASWRGRPVTAGGELLAVALLSTATVAAAFALEGWLEAGLFAGDFQGWLFNHVGVTYDQRNAVVVGFALGFAVIPLIFTLTEDAFSNVPPSLVSASLALGATRWQAARSVVLPAASPGMFAAVMIGFGRAVGETMIVLMATGNTPIMSLSPFNGMRTMSACIAVELPEAPFGGTLYRVLILTALLLFVFTFVINTLAVVVAARLRRRFGRLAA